MQKTFLRVIESNSGNVTLDQYIECIAGGVPSDEASGHHVPCMSFPGSISKVRAYVFSCLSGEENTNRFNDEIFLAGCFRYALECPTPIISTRVALYGNTRDVMTAI